MPWIVSGTSCCLLIIYEAFNDYLMADWKIHFSIWLYQQTKSESYTHNTILVKVTCVSLHQLKYSTRYAVPIMPDIACVCITYTDMNCHGVSRPLYLDVSLCNMYRSSPVNMTHYINLSDICFFYNRSCITEFKIWYEFRLIWISNKLTKNQWLWLSQIGHDISNMHHVVMIDFARHIPKIITYLRWHISP